MVRVHSYGAAIPWRRGEPRRELGEARGGAPLISAYACALRSELVEAECICICLETSLAYSPPARAMSSSWRPACEIQARRDMARRGVAWRGVAWHGVAWRDTAWHGTACGGVAWRGVARRGAAWRGVA